jgi:nucleoside-diphosphate-sugar epimerase
MSRGVERTESTMPYSLEDDIRPEALRGLDALIHCAHDFRVRTRADMERVNVEGSMRLVRAAKAAGVETFVFISTMAAFDGCRSLYGQTKLVVEREVARQGGWVLRPGTIYGKQVGGLIASLRQVVARLPVVPVIGTGQFPVFVAHEADLCELIFALCASPSPGTESPPISAAARHPILFGQLLRELAAAQGKKPVFIPVPWRIVLWGLQLLETLGPQPSLRSDSVTSLVHYNRHPDFGATGHMGIRFREFSLAELSPEVQSAAKD